MICSHTFLDIYNSTFKWIDENYGYEAVCKYWEHISKHTLADLKDLVERKGLYGCDIYWKTVLSAEGAGFMIVCDEDRFSLEISDCPSLRHLGSDAYSEYCDHCQVMYKPIFDELGYNYQITGKGGECAITVSKSNQSTQQTRTSYASSSNK